jgi:cell wall assembly regulator SMI1
VRGVDIPVDESWRRITTWLARHAPVTAAAIRPSAGAAEVRRTAEAVGRTLPRDLLGWWGLMDGIADADYRAGCPIPPFYAPLPVAGVRERYAGLSRFADRDCCGAGGAHATVAGEPSFGFCTATVPICWDLGGDVLVADLRGGTRHGCVMTWMAEQGYSETAWAGTAAMLADVVDLLDDLTQTEIVNGGALQWTRSPDHGRS